MTAPDPAAPGSAAHPLLFLPERPAPGVDDARPAGARHPLVRTLTAALLLAAAAVHNRLVVGTGGSEPLLALAAFMAAYAAVSWLPSRRRRRDDPPRPDAAVFLLLDLLPLAATVYATGASASWLFWIFLLHPIQELPAGPARSAAAAVLAAFGYAAVVAVAAGAEALMWEAEIGKLALLALGGVVVAHAAWRSGRDRGRLLERLREASDRASELVEDYAHLEGAADERARAGSEFLLRLGREVRGPLLELLRSAGMLEAAALAPDQRRRVREVLDGGRHLLDIANEVVDLARVQSGSLARELGPVAVRPALDEVLEQAFGAAERRAIALPRRAPLASDVWVVANERKLRQVFANLISNAIKYNRPGGRVGVECEPRDGRLRVSVHDTGPGIPPDQVEAAFAPFDRPGAESFGVAGTGLGLTLARSLVHAMNGQLGLTTEPGHGSTFWFELEVTDPPPPGSTSARAGGADGEPVWPEGDPAAFLPAPPSAAPPLLLYIDASPENATRLGRLLDRRPDVHLLWTPLGRQGLEQARARRPALIVLHLRLLDLPADEVLRRIRATPSLERVPVVRVVPEDATDEERTGLEDEAVAGTLTTPCDEAAFLELLDRVLPPF